MKRVYVAGHRGMVGSALVAKLKSMANCEIICKTSKELDLRDQQAVFNFLKSEKIDEVYIAAAKVGGIHANNTYPADFIYDNLAIACNLIHGAHLAGIDKLLFLGSSCIYPKYAPQPIPENALLTGKLEPTNEPYAIAKIAGIKLCESYNRQYGHDYRSVMPTNLYGPNDNFHPHNSHVIPALIRRFHEAVINKQDEVIVWGSGEPRREFLYVDDLAEACIFVMNLPKHTYNSITEPMLSHINIGSGEDYKISEIAQKVANTVGFTGKIVYDRTKPDGTPRKLLDISKIVSLGWKPKISLDEGLRLTYKWFLDNYEISRK